MAGSHEPAIGYQVALYQEFRWLAAFVFALRLLTMP
jgi:hypothetical protein